MASPERTAVKSSAELLTLMSWLSPVFPTGGFAYSAGLEQAAVQGLVDSPVALEDWIAAQLAHGGLRNDAILLSRAYDAASDRAAITELADLAAALCVCAQRLRETTDQGTSFLNAAAHWIGADRLPGRGTPLPVAVGAAAGLALVDRAAAIAAYLHGFVSNQLQCAIRLSITGQDGAAGILSRIEPAIYACALDAGDATLDDLGGAAFIADSMAMRHETLEPRLFLS